MTNPATQYRYTLSPEQQQRFADIYLLRRMINGQEALSVNLQGDDTFLEPILTRLGNKGWITTNTRSAQYVATQAGREPLQKFEQRYYDYLKMYDAPYPAVDLVYGDFGHTYASFFSSKETLMELVRQDRWRPYMDRFLPFFTGKTWDQKNCDAAFGTFLNLEPWEDLRVAVAEYKGLDPLEIIFMSFLNEGKFDQPRQSWQFDLHSGWFFQEVERVANKAIHRDQVVAEGATSDEIMQNIIIGGTELMMNILIQQAEAEQQYAAEQAITSAQQNPAQPTNTQSVTTTTTETYVEEVVSYVPVVPRYYSRDYYNVYIADPFYVAPIWVDPWYW